MIATRASKPTGNIDDAGVKTKLTGMHASEHLRLAKQAAVSEGDDDDDDIFARKGGKTKSKSKLKAAQQQDGG